MEAEVVATQCQEQLAYRKSEMLGQAFGLAIGLAAIIGAVIMALHGAQVAATFIGTGGVTSLVSAFILGRTLPLKYRKQEFEQQKQLMAQEKGESERAEG